MSDTGRSFWQVCAHSQTTPPDEYGDVICADRGGRVRVVLTRAGFEDAMDTIYRDFGSFRRHSKRCVRLEGGGFLCVTDCTLAVLTSHDGGTEEPDAA